MCKTLVIFQACEITFMLIIQVILYIINPTVLVVNYEHKFPQNGSMMQLFPSRNMRIKHFNLICANVLLMKKNKAH